MRYIKIDDNNKVYCIRFGENIIHGEIQSDLGELGQILQSDGSFIYDESEPEKPEKEQSIEEKINYVQNQNLVLMDALATIFELLTGGV